MTSALVYEIGAPVAERERLGSAPQGIEDGLFGIYFVLNQIREEQEKLAASLLAHEQEVNAVLRGDKANGDKGLSWRMRDVERQVGEMRAQMDRIESAINARGLAAETGRWSLTQAVIVAIVTGFFLLGVALLSGIFKSGGKS